LEKALAKKDAVTLSDLIFDAECEGFANEIDLQWYERTASNMTDELA